MLLHSRENQENPGYPGDSGFSGYFGKSANIWVGVRSKRDNFAPCSKIRFCFGLFSCRFLRSPRVKIKEKVGERRNGMGREKADGERIII